MRHSQDPQNSSSISLRVGKSTLTELSKLRRLCCFAQYRKMGKESTHSLKILHMHRLLLLPTAVIGRFACNSDGWEVTPSDAYAWTRKPPQGCSCKATGIPLSECEASVCATCTQKMQHAHTSLWYLPNQATACAADSLTTSLMAFVASIGLKRIDRCSHHLDQVTYILSARILHMPSPTNLSTECTIHIKL